MPDLRRHERMFMTGQNNRNSQMGYQFLPGELGVRSCSALPITDQSHPIFFHRDPSSSLVNLGCAPDPSCLIAD